MTDRLELGQIEEAIDWQSTTAWEGEVHPGQLKLEVDALVDQELEEAPRVAPPGPGHRPASPTGGAPTLPRVEVRRLKSVSWVVYHAMSGHEHVIGRYRDAVVAEHQARAYARIQDCPVEVEDG